MEREVPGWRSVRVLSLAAATAVVACVGAVPARAQDVANLDAAPGTSRAAVAPDRLIVRFRDDAHGAARLERFRRLDVRRVRRLPVSGMELVRTRDGESVSAAIRRLERRPGVAYAEPDYVNQASFAPNDPFLSEQYALHNFGQIVGGFEAGTADADIDAPEAWDVTRGSTDVLVAVIDSGIDTSHPELSAALFTNDGERGGGSETNGLDDDGNGLVDDWRGWDFVDDDNDITDLGLFPHGTAVAGTIAAKSHDGVGVAGVAPGAKVLGIRTANRAGSSFTSDNILAYGYVAELGADIVNLSFGRQGGFSQAEEDAIRAASSSLFVISAGNDAADNDAIPAYPCNVDAANVVCVGATGQSDELASFSNHGATSVDLLAPGVGVLTTAPARDVKLADDFESDIAGRWTIAGTNAAWARTSAFSRGGAFSLTDSPAGAYQNNTASHATADQSIDLTGETGCRVDWWMRLSSQLGVDGILVSAASGGPFQVLRGVSGGTGGAFLPFDADLEAFEGSSAVQLRLGFTSDATVTDDGVYVDDLVASCLGESYIGTELIYADGTSFSAPVVTGIAALVQSVAPDLTPTEVAQALADGSEAPPQLTGLSVHGRANAARSLAAILPEATTEAAAGVTSSAATLRGVARPRGAAATAYFEYGTTAAYGARTGPITLDPTSGDQPVGVALSGLPGSTTVHFRLVVEAAAGTASGAESSFTTAPRGVVTVARDDIAPSLTGMSARRDRTGRATLRFTASETAHVEIMVRDGQRRLKAHEVDAGAGTVVVKLGKVRKKAEIRLLARDARGNVGQAFARVKQTRKRKRSSTAAIARVAARAIAAPRGHGNPNMNLPTNPQQAQQLPPPKVVLDCTQGCSQRTRDDVYRIPVGGGDPIPLDPVPITCQLGQCSDGFPDPTAPAGFAPAEETDGTRNCVNPLPSGCRLITQDAADQEKLDREEERKKLAGAGGLIGTLVSKPGGASAKTGAGMGTGAAGVFVWVHQQNEARIDAGTTIVPKDHPYAKDAPPQPATGPTDRTGGGSASSSRAAMQAALDSLVRPRRIHMRISTRGIPARHRAGFKRLMSSISAEASLARAAGASLERAQAAAAAGDAGASARHVLAADAYLGQVLDLRRSERPLARRVAPDMARIETRITKRQAARTLKRLADRGLSRRDLRALRPFGLTNADVQELARLLTPRQIKGRPVSRELVARTSGKARRDLTRLRAALRASA